MIKLVDMQKGIEGSFLDELKKRGNRSMEEAVVTASEIIHMVRSEGDGALYKLTKKFDGVDLEGSALQVSDADFEKAYKSVDSELLMAIRNAAENIRDFHSRQLEQSWLYVGKEDVVLGQIVNPLDKVGIYVPGGTAPLISSVLMNAIPAEVAGVKNIILCTPPDKTSGVNPAILAAAKESGVSRVFKVGGAQAIAAMAFGTQCIQAVDKITGPGNIYVAAAKRLVYGYVGIDMVAGPSEILVIGDEFSNPAYVAADMLSQAEHDALAAAILVTDSRKLAEGVINEVEKQAARLDRREILAKSLRDNCRIILTSDLETAVEISNSIAPEHLELNVREPYKLMGRVKNAGAIFLGEYSPEPVGDYFAGPNHVLPTGGSSRFSSPLGVYDFIKRSSVIGFTKTALFNAGSEIMHFAKAEGLTAHANAIGVRLDN
ncbi:MAG: histidinol dehydrogenase [Eubacteriales bacterium]|nr:histidinol dehydrogenase [Eubacteriales bacterium]